MSRYLVIAARQREDEGEQWARPVANASRVQWGAMHSPRLKTALQEVLTDPPTTMGTKQQLEQQQAAAVDDAAASMDLQAALHATARWLGANCPRCAAADGCAAASDHDKALPLTKYAARVVPPCAGRKQPARIARQPGDPDTSAHKLVGERFHEHDQVAAPMSASRTGAPPPTARPPSVHNVKMGPLRCPRATTDEDARACMAQGECQFRIRREAQRFCDGQADCKAVLLHPFGGDCAGGLGCYTPRRGEEGTADLWARTGGKLWVKVPGKHGAPCTHSASSRYRTGCSGSAKVCEQRGGRLASPRSGEERSALQGALDAAQADGKLSHTWPRNTIWLGGEWNASSERWEWSGGAPVDHFNWAADQPSSKGHQESEPWLCMVLSGETHDSKDEPGNESKSNVRGGGGRGTTAVHHHGAARGAARGVRPGRG
ncbi:unnamed protein product [Prorocentrum cordatum]|uniref:C-type lectin domain-containing protein n=1 Tax=Prorocentrum cordatum TaxID=2364126 RepID=A0ABN9QZG3_9DINO|nr:unnamed protein product [Polarella glacialis]